MARRLYEDEEIPVARRARFHAALVDDGDDRVRYSLEMFRFIATGAPTTSPRTPPGISRNRSPQHR